jgi:hypothetical protein
MQTITLYRYIREGGGVTVSPVMPECEYATIYRLVADEGRALTQDGTTTTCCADVISTDGWYEVDAPVVYPAGWNEVE